MDYLLLTKVGCFMTHACGLYLVLQIKIWEDWKPQPIAILRPHDGNPIHSATFLSAPDCPHHIILITGVRANIVHGKHLLTETNVFFDE